MNATVYTAETAEDRETALAAVEKAVLDGRTAVIPTDTVYGIAADAFSRGGVQQLLNAKGRSRRMPPPVLIADASVLPGLADDLSADAEALAEAFWPGALTLIVYSQPSLNWDLGETHGTVALRVPNDDLTREILRRTGPLAVSSANRTGQNAATTAQEAAEQLGDRVELIVDGGIRPLGRAAETPSAEAAPSTIIDATGERPVVVRAGALDLDELRKVAPRLVTREELEREEPASDEASPSVRGPGEGPKASEAQPGSVEESLVGGPRTGAPDQARSVDQLRTRETAEGQKRRARKAQTRPLGVEEARSLLFPSPGDERS
ncbi:L-threonylcarbamoyladenylate synthase [Curtobacterium sp. S6]|uniref:L-threonylcarbamoyladenylate synthase n=1 Tax=Curtobacterium sp. S6 TaxID=1479623 RepID=UPI00068A79AF|nr:L-threonylcarbamoyladenylate synthase [Curtobacterium sp. S6]